MRTIDNIFNWIYDHWRTLVLAGAVVLVLGILLFGTGCSKYTEPFRDSPRSGIVNDDEADLITNPDGFSNAATKCDHGNRLYVLYHGDKAYGGIEVVPQDPTCSQE